MECPGGVWFSSCLGSRMTGWPGAVACPLWSSRSWLGHLVAEASRKPRSLCSKRVVTWPAAPPGKLPLSWAAISEALGGDTQAGAHGTQEATAVTLTWRC